MDVHKVLVVDNETEALSELKRLLGEEGFEVDTASCAEEALDLLEGAGYAAVLVA